MAEQLQQKNENLDLIKIVFEDEDIMVLDKPAGVVVTSEGVKKETTLEEWLGEKFTWLRKVERHGIVHRLDKGTSGLIVITKNGDTEKLMKKKFKNREVRKKYWALIGGETTADGEVKAPIGRSRYSFGRWKVDEDGKEAWTVFRTIGRYKREGKKYSLVEIDLKTGRTHQIRVHFAYLRWPLVGDGIYGGETLTLKRPFLQSKELSFVHPVTGEVCNFRSELAPDLIEELKFYEKY